MNEFTEWLPLISRAAVLGLLAGVGLVLVQLYSRRGPLIFPVYAALLASLGLVSNRYEQLPFVAHFAAVLAGMLIATTCTLVAVIILASRERQRLVAAGRAFAAAPGGAPWWGLPLIAGCIALSSAAVAYVSS
jgi:hypothetical protein